MRKEKLLALLALVLGTVAASSVNVDGSSGSTVYYRYGEYIESDYRIKIEAPQLSGMGMWLEMTPHQLPKFRVERQAILHAEDIKSGEGATKIQFAFGHRRFSTPFFGVGGTYFRLKSVDFTFSYRGHEIVDIDYVPNYDLSSSEVKDVEVNYSWKFVGETNPEMAMGILLLISFLVGGTGVGVAFASELMKGTDVVRGRREEGPFQGSRRKIPDDYFDDAKNK